MSLLDLHTLVSTEDFADAHEPLNDGIKKVPNAQTVAASTKTGDVGTDTTSAGPAKVIPEKKDTDDVTKTEHNVVKESAEKSDAKPAAPTPKDKSDETSEDSGSGDDATPKPAKPETADDESEEKPEPLAHDTEKATKDELEKTEKAKEALEAYAPRARTFDIIGHPKVQSDRIAKLVTYVHRRSGQAAPKTVSLESVSTAIELSQKRIAKLERDLTHFSKVSAENFDEQVVEETIVTEQPTETGGELLPPPVAEGITELETDPLDVPMLEINRVQETIDVLTQSNVAVERYLEIIRANPKMSKQAAAVLHAGLEHIDRVCELKVRSTGMENYLTTPRAAMEEADVKEKSLLDRAGEIGAKILKWIKELVEKSIDSWSKYRTGIDSLKDKCLELSKKKFNTEGVTKLQPVPEILFMEGEFFGDWPTPDEETLAKNITSHYTKLTTEIKRRVANLLRDKSPEDIILVMEALRSDDTDKTLAELPGPHWVASNEGRLVLSKGNPEAPESHSLENSEIQPVRLMRATAKMLSELSELDVVSLLRKSSEEVTQALIKYRKGHGKDIDESEFQKVQTAVVDNSIKLFDINSYFAILKYVASISNARYKLCERLAVQD